MNPPDKRFSSRHGLHRPHDGPLIRDAAPEAIRCALLNVAELNASTLRSIVCGVLRRRPDPGNWSVSNIWDEVQEHVHGCAWYKVYDIIEAIYAHLERRGEIDKLVNFINAMNQAFVEEGIGWELLVDGGIETRGDDAYEEAIHEAHETLEANDLAVAAQELKEARLDLSRRPEPDLSGAVQHASASLESVLRQCSGGDRGTLGELVRRNREMFPAPLDEAVEKLWGFASEQARHGSEDRQLEWEEAQLCVGIAAVVGSYLASKHLHDGT